MPGGTHQGVVRRVSPVPEDNMEESNGIESIGLSAIIPEDRDRARPGLWIPERM
jgi:hypothetical protein